MDKLKLIIKREFLAKVKNKSFIILTILSPILMAGLILFVIFINTQNNDEIRQIAFVDASEMLSTAFVNKSNLKFTDLSELALESARDMAKEQFDGLVYIPEYENLDALADGIQFFSKDAPGISLVTDLEHLLERKIRDLKLKSSNIELEIIENAETNVNLLTESYSGEKSSKVLSILKMIIGGGFGYLIFMFIIIYGTSVMRSVIEEKTSRIIEVIISSVHPFQLMLGKIFGNALAGILQFVIWMISAGILLTVITAAFGPDATAMTGPMEQMGPDVAAQLNSTENSDIQLALSQLSELPILTMFFSFIIYFLGGYLIYSSIYAAIGAAVDSETDTQQFMMPVLLPLIIAIYVGFSVVENPHGPMAVGFSLFPLTSPIVMLIRIPFEVPTWQLILSMALLLVTFLGIVWFAAKIYRIGILMYGKRPSYKELYKWLKY